ncbi:Ig-like domain-containing protein [Diaphorobacter sp.]|uniref:tandem-95 repeat protein n=1 Tax=Diaphorobacter sp. TaxID=1934310 RepID=UPI0025896328|nr:Ig-like domain-containing protein [Diaphorobacter sp.]
MQNTPHVADLPLHLVVVDSGLPDLHILLADLPANTRVHYIHEHEDALSQIAYAASQYEDLEGLHVLGHGEPGRMLMGGQWIDAEAVESSPDQMASISGALSDDAHIWLYGCHSALGDVGQSWLDSWALATGAGVHGSTHQVGSGASGIRWDLPIEVCTKVFVSVKTINNPVAPCLGNSWNNSLVTNTAPSFFSGDSDGIVEFKSLMTRPYTYGGMDVLLDGHIVLAANGYEKKSEYKGVIINKIAKYLPDGGLNYEFGNQGEVYFSENYNILYLKSLPDNSLLLLCADRIIKLDASGQLLRSFGVNGQIIIDQPIKLNLTPDGGFMVATNWRPLWGSGDAKIYKYDSDGQRDLSFGLQGVITVGTARDEYVQDMEIRADGRIYLSIGNGIYRLKADGSFDISFSGDGVSLEGSSFRDLELSLGGGGLAVIDNIVTKITATGGIDAAYGNQGSVVLGTAFQQFYVGGAVDSTGNAYFVFTQLLEGGVLGNKIFLYGLDKNGSPLGGADSYLLQSLTLSDYEYLSLDEIVFFDESFFISGQAKDAEGVKGLIIKLNKFGELDGAFDAAYTLTGIFDYVENGHRVIISPNALVHDLELDAAGDYSGAWVEIYRSGGDNSEDKFSFSGDLYFDSGKIFDDIGLLGNISEGNGRLLIEFRGDAFIDHSRIVNAIRSINYENLSDNPPEVVELQWIFNDGNSGDQGLGGALETAGITSIEIIPVNDPPVANSSAINSDEDMVLGGALLADDVDSLNLSFTVVEKPLRGVLDLALNGTFTYTPAANYSGTDSFTFKASDATLDSNTATVSITVTPVNDAPVLTNALADRSVTLGSILNFAFAGNTFTDVDSPSLTYTAKLANGAALPSWLSFNPVTRTFSGTPGAADLGTLTVQVTASDGALSVADAFDLVISERPNTSPTAANATVSTKEDTPLTGTLPGATDAEGDPVTYAKASDPAKGTVSVGASGTFTYTPAANANGSDSFTYSVTDDRGASSTYAVSLTITPVNDAPEITTLAPLAFVDTAQSDVFVLEQTGQIQAQDIDSVQLSYHISGGTNVGAYSKVQGTYGSLQVHIGTGAYTFFANNAAIQGLKSNASETYTVTVSDGALTAQAPMSVQITGANDAPVLIAPLSDQTAYDASAWSLTLSDTHFSDADTGDVLSYSASLDDGGALPSWLSFDPATRMFSGTPSAADVGSLSIRVSASDGSLSASDVFSLVVNAYFEPVVDDSSVATYARSANQYTIRFDPVSKDLLVTDTDPQQYEVRKFTDAKRIEFEDLTLNLAVSDLADTIAEPALNRIAELYVAFFNRVPDGDGMEFWLGQYRQGKTINDIADAFYNAGVYFSDLTGYRADMSNDDFIHIVYRNVLGRPEGADQEGLAFWRAELDSGRSAKGTLVSSILDAAHGSTFSDPTNSYHWVQKLLDNKLEVAKQVSVDWGVNYNSSEDSIAKGQAIAAAITPDDTSMAISLVGVVVADME